MFFIFIFLLKFHFVHLKLVAEFIVHSFHLAAVLCYMLSDLLHIHSFTAWMDVCDYSTVNLPKGGQGRTAFQGATLIKIRMTH